MNEDDLIKLCEDTIRAMHFVKNANKAYDVCLEFSSEGKHWAKNFYNRHDTFLYQFPFYRIKK